MFILQLYNDKTADWFEINETGAVVTREHLIELSQAPKINSTAHLIALLPGENVTMTSVKLPKMSASEKLLAIPFALEEQLTENPETILVSVGNVQSSGASTVAVIKKELFESELNALHEMNLHPQCLLPDFLALSWTSETWSVLLHDQMAIVRTDLQNGFSVDANNLLLFLQLQLEKNKDAAPKKIIVWQENTIVNEVQFEKLKIPIEIRSETKQSFFNHQELLSHPAINFLQGKYRPKTQSSEFQRNWIVCGATAAALILFLFLSQCAQWFYLRHQSIVLEKQVLQVYQTLFPGAKDVLEPRFRTAGLLKQFDAASQSSQFLTIMGVAGKTLLQFPDIQAQSIQFENQQLHLTVNAKNVELLGQWSQALRAQRLQVTQHVLKTTKDAVSAEITVKDNA